MGGDSSKHSNASSAQTRSRERKRSGLSSALAGGDCRSGPLGDRTARVGPVYGEAPDYIPPSPVRCTVVPIAARSQLDAALTWIPDTEAALIAEWNCERLDGGATAAAAAAAAVAEAQHPRGGSSANAGAAGAKVAPSPTTPGMTSSSTCPASTPPSPMHLQTSSGLPATCDVEDVLRGRSTGLTFKVPTTWTQLHAPHITSTSASSKSLHSPTSPKAPALAQQPNAGLAGASASAPVVVAALPVGMEYFRALQTRWLAPAQRAMPPATDEDDLNDSAILEAVAESNGDVLSPPVPLGYMIDLFVPQWQSEGLYEAAQDYQRRR